MFRTQKWLAVGVGSLGLLLSACGVGAENQIGIDNEVRPKQVIGDREVQTIVTTLHMPDQATQQLESTLSQPITRGTAASTLTVREMALRTPNLTVTYNDVTASGSIQTPTATIEFARRADGKYLASNRVFDTEEQMVQAMESDATLTAIPIGTLVATHEALQASDSPDATPNPLNRGFFSFIKKALKRIFKFAACAVVGKLGFTLKSCS